MIRITGGTHRGRPLPHPVPATARPTSSRVREAIFSMVGQDLSGWSMLDLFGGSGLMALEAASRGAGPVTVVERDARAAAAVRANAAALGAALRVRVEDAARAALDPADLVFLDPPYADGVERWLARGASLCTRVLVMEARSGARWPASVEGARGDLNLSRERAYGDTVVGVYRAEDGETA